MLAPADALRARATAKTPSCTPFSRSGWSRSRKTTPNSASRPSNHREDKGALRLASGRHLHGLPRPGRRSAAISSSNVPARKDPESPLPRLLGPELRLGSRPGPRQRAHQGGPGDADADRWPQILLLPAWPNEWDVDFKLHAPYKTTLEGTSATASSKRLTSEPGGPPCRRTGDHPEMSSPRLDQNKLPGPGLGDTLPR